MWERFTGRTRQAILLSQNISSQHRSGCVGSAHLFLGILESEFSPTADSNSNFRLLCALKGFKVQEARLYAEAALESVAETSSDDAPKLTASAKSVLEIAVQEAELCGTAHIAPEHLFLACLRPQKVACVAEVLRPLGIDAAEWRRDIKRIYAVPIPSDHPLKMLDASGSAAVEAAYDTMRRSYCGRISTLHLLIGILTNESDNANVLLQHLGTDRDELLKRARANLTNDDEAATSEKRFTPAAKRALERAKTESLRQKKRQISATHILTGLLPQSPTRRENIAFGKDLLDEAAPLLAPVTPAQLIALQTRVLPKSVAPKVAEAKVASPLPTTKESPSGVPAVCTFIISSFSALGIGSISGTSFSAAPWRYLSAGVFLATLTVTALIATAMVLFSKRPARKFTWVTAFISALIGGSLAIMAIGH